MTAAVATSVRTAKSLAATTRVLLVALGVLVLVAASFLVGRTTVGSSRPSVASRVATQPSTATGHVGRPC